MERSEALELFELCAGSDESALWQRFVDCFGGAIRGGVVRALRRFATRIDADTVDELVQEVYCRLLEKDRRALRRCRADQEAIVRGYLSCICTSVVVDRLRFKGSAKRGGRMTFVELRDEQDFDDIQMIADPGISPEQGYMVRETREHFLESCRRYFRGARRDRNLEIFELAFVEGWTSREISLHIDGQLKPGSIDSMIHRQRRRLLALGVDVPTR